MGTERAELGHTNTIAVVEIKQTIFVIQISLLSVPCQGTHWNQCLNRDTFINTVYSAASPAYFRELQKVNDSLIIADQARLARMIWRNFLVVVTFSPTSQIREREQKKTEAN